VPDALLFHFAQVADRVAAVSAKLEKQRILAEFLATLNDSDLCAAIRYSDGRAFDRGDERALGVSGAILLDAVGPIVGKSYSELRPLFIKHGEFGNALGEVWAEVFPVIQSSGREPTLTLAELGRAFDEIASTTKPEEKRPIVARLFESCARPEEARYLAKIILGDLRTGVREGVLISAVAKAFSRDEADVRRAMLLVGDLEVVALLAKSNRLGEAKFTLFRPLQFMLASPIASASELKGDFEYSAEPKLDGIRVQVHKQAGKIAIFTRTMDRVDASFPEIVESLRAVEHDFILDGEIIAWQETMSGGRVGPFANLQKRLGRVRDLARSVRTNPCIIVGFDLIFLDGDLLIDRPYTERRAKLIECRFPKVIEAILVRDIASIELEFENQKSLGNEGLMLKEPASPYAPGKRGQAWLKLKTHLPTLDCVVTAAERGHGKRRDVLSDYTFALWTKSPAETDAKLVNIGKAYSGLTDIEIATLTERFKQITLTDDGRRHIVKPEVVLEIAFEAVQKSNRHDSGYALRFPRILRIRDDKRPEDADRIDAIESIFQHQNNTNRTEAKIDPQMNLFD